MTGTGSLDGAGKLRPRGNLHAATVAVQMDHIASIRIAGDSTFALLLEAQRRGHRLSTIRRTGSPLRAATVTALVEPLTVADVPAATSSLGEA